MRRRLEQKGVPEGPPGESLPPRRCLMVLLRPPVLLRVGRDRFVARVCAERRRLVVQRLRPLRLACVVREWSVVTALWQQAR